MKYEKVKKEYIYNAEQVSEQATTYFFALAMAQAEYDLAKENAISTDTLYRIDVYKRQGYKYVFPGSDPSVKCVCSGSGSKSCC